MLNKIKQRSKSLVKELVKRVRPKFEKFVSSTEPAIVIMISVAAIVWSISATILAVSLLFGFYDSLIPQITYIAITPFLPFVIIAVVTFIEIVMKTATKVVYKCFEKFEERVKRYAETRSVKDRESHFVKVAKKIDDETLELILKRSQIFSISMWLQFAACVMLGLIAMKEPYDGNVQKALIRFILPITIYVVALVLFGIYEYFDKVNTAKSQLKKSDDQNSDSGDE